MTSIDMSGLPDFSGVAEKVQQAAAGLKKAGAGIQETGRRVNSVWTKGGLRQFYTAPEAEKVLAAMGPVQAEGDTVGSQTATVVSALEAFAAEVAKIQQQLTILKADIADFNGDVMGDPDAMEDDATRDRYNSLINRMNAWGVTAFQRAERDCANKINALTGGPHYVPGEFGDDHGKLPPGYQRYGWARLPDGARVPWGSTVKEPDPWWERFAKGAGKAAWGMVTGTFSLVDFTNTETFLASWDGLLKLGYGSSPVILAASAIRGDGRAKEGLEAWKALGKDFIGWDEHAKGNHAGALGATAVNVATFGPLTKLLKAGKFGKGGKAAASAAGHIPGFTGLVNSGRSAFATIQEKLASLRGTKAPRVIDPASIRIDPPARAPHTVPDPRPTVGDVRRQIDDIGRRYEPDFQNVDRRPGARPPHNDDNLPPVPRDRTPELATVGGRPPHEINSAHKPPHTGEGDRNPTSGGGSDRTPLGREGSPEGTARRPGGEGGNGPVAPRQGTPGAGELDGNGRPRTQPGGGGDREAPPSGEKPDNSASGQSPEEGTGRKPDTENNEAAGNSEDLPRRDTSQEPLPKGMYIGEDGRLHKPGDAEGEYWTADGRLHYEGDPPGSFRQEDTRRLHDRNGNFLPDPRSKDHLDFLAQKGDKQGYTPTPEAAARIEELVAKRTPVEKNRANLNSEIRKLLGIKKFGDKNEFGIDDIHDLSEKKLEKKIDELLERVQNDPHLSMEQKQQQLAKLDQLRDLADDYNKEGKVLQRLSERLGMVGAEDFAGRRGVKLTPLFDGPGRSGTLDVVSVEENRLKLVVVEGKGAGSTLGESKVGGGKKAEQGSPEYLEWLLGRDPDLRKALENNPELRARLQAALDEGKLEVEYHLVHVDKHGKATTLEFDLSRDGRPLKIRRVAGLTPVG
ncbi:hypothetical protein [Actinomadura miaoliensis]|uniref:Uncharacterized protein n=1 Tax=Actinomadura miaoliensis TaxID=430685 RepID=A0ABP7V5U2_9ACTN